MRLLFILSLILIIGGMPLFLWGINPLFLHVPRPSEVYDCDDAALQMLNRFEGIGMEAVPVIGNLGMTGEKKSEINHAWVVLRLPLGKKLAFDWGSPQVDSQHYEYYEITSEELRWFVEEDFN